ncbi:hypothetical protein [Streptomyces sp. Inha503]
MSSGTPRRCQLVGRAINGVELPDYAGVPDSAVPAGSPITSSAKP